MQEALLLRVNRASEFGKGLDALLKTGELSTQKLNEIGGLARTSWALKVARVWFDNLIVTVRADVYSAEYINVVPDGSGYYLRVRENGDLGKALRHLLGVGRPVGEDELAEVAGLERIRWSIKLVDRWFDNIGINAAKVGDKWEYTANYMDVTPKTEVVGAEVGGSEPVPVDGSVVMVWPEAPPVPAKMKNYDRTSEHGEVLWALEKGKHVAMESPPSVGKDTLLEQVAAELDMPLSTVGADLGLRREHLEGTQEMRNNTSFFKVSDYAAAAVKGWAVTVPEVNAADPGVAVYMNPQLDGKGVISINGHMYPVHPNFRLIVTYNAGLTGTRPLNDAYKDRFWPVKMKWFTHKQLRKRLECWNLPDTDSDDVEWGEFIVQFGMDMRAAFDNGDIRYHITVRRLIDAIDYKLDHPEADIKAVLRKAAIDTIDAPLDIKAAEKVLRDVTVDLSKYYVKEIVEKAAEGLPKREGVATGESGRF